MYSYRQEPDAQVSKYRFMLSQQLWRMLPQCTYHLLEVDGVSIPPDTGRAVPKASSPPGGRLFIPRGQRSLIQDVCYNPTVLVQEGSLCRPEGAAAVRQLTQGTQPAAL